MRNIDNLDSRGARRTSRAAVTAILWGFTLAFGACAPGLPAKEYVLVVDGSASMNRPAGSGSSGSYLDALKGALRRFVAGIESDAAVTLFSFSVELSRPQAFAANPDGRAKLSAAIDGLEAGGQWTHTRKMALGVAKHLTLARGGRQPVVLVFSDGLDDPPPGTAASERLSLRELKKVLAGGDDLRANNFVYDIDLAKLAGLAGKVSAAGEGAPPDLKSALDDRLAETKAWSDWAYWDKHVLNAEWFPWAAYAVAALAIAGLLWWVYAWFTRLAGVLTYFEKGFARYSTETVDLGKFKKHKLQIGRGVDSDLRIRALDRRRPFEIIAAGNRFQPRFRVVAIPAEDLVFHNEDATGLVAPGMKFRLANIEFEYRLEPHAASAPAGRTEA